MLPRGKHNIASAAAPAAGLSMAAALPELLIAATVIAAFGAIWLSYVAEQKGRHRLPVVLIWAACLLAAISAIWWTSQ
jgi:hypothetical protein